VIQVNLTEIINAQNNR